MKLLVTGGLGFIGSSFIEGALEMGGVSRVVNVDNLSLGSSKVNRKRRQHDPKYRFVEGDITDAKLISRLVTNSDVIVNFAAETHVDRSIFDPRPFLRSNTEGVLCILETIRTNARDATLVQVSTDEVYGDVARGSANEGDALNPSSPYAASKAAGDLLCLAYHRTYGLKTIVTRCTNNFGPRQSPEKFIPKTVIRAHLDLEIPLYGDGSNVRDWLYVEDHCEALRAVLAKGRPGRIYNIAGHNELSNVDVVRLILKIQGKPENLIQHVEDRPGHDRRYSLSDEMLRTELGWRPRRAFEEALEETVNWYLENEDWWRPLADEKTLSSAPWKRG